MNIVLFHSSDYDGFVSAKVIHDYLYGQKEAHITEFKPHTYGWSLNVKDIVDRLGHNGNLYLSDLSLDSKDMVYLQEQLKDRFIWCDHHISAIDESEKYGYDKLPGIRSINFAGCELTYMYLYPGTMLPDAVSLAGRYDIFDKDNSKWDFELHLVPFQKFLNNKLPTWESVLESDLLQWDAERLTKYLKVGRFLYAYEDSLNLKHCWSTFERTFHGLRFLCLNSTTFSSQTFKSKIDYKKHDAMMVFVYNGKKRIWKISMYTEKPNIALNKIAEQYKGGGHASACGFLYSGDFIGLLNKNK